MFTSKRTKPEQLPEDGCLVVVEYLDQETPKRITHSGYDFYFWWDSPEGLVIGSNSEDRETNESRYPEATWVRGKWTTPAEMTWARERAQESQWP